MIEQTIVNHQPRYKEKVVVTKNRVEYPSNPENGYVSKWPIASHGCLGYRKKDTCSTHVRSGKTET